MTSRKPSSRKPGAQPGNTNALKHGFYSRQFRAIDLDVISASLDNEIAAPCVWTRRLVDGVDESDFNTMHKAITGMTKKILHRTARAL